MKTQTRYEALRDVVIAWTVAGAVTTRSLERWCVLVSTLRGLGSSARMLQALAAIGAEIDARARRERRSFAAVCEDMQRDLSIGEVATVDLLVETLAEAYGDGADVSAEELTPAIGKVVTPP